MLSSQTLDLQKMVQRVIKLMCLLEWWEPMVMQHQNMSWRVSLVGYAKSKFAGLAAIFQWSNAWSFSGIWLHIWWAFICLQIHIFWSWWLSLKYFWKIFGIWLLLLLLQCSWSLLGNVIWFPHKAD